jgi:hypothetical protein
MDAIATKLGDTKQTAERTGFQRKKSANLL